MKLIAYYRTSTGKQRLSIDAQKEAITAYAARNGFQIVAEYTEVKSGGDNDRPQLKLAIQRTEGCKGRLVVAKLDRLSRSLAFIATLMEAEVDFVAADNEVANPLNYQILGAVAEAERKAIGQRTKDALAAAKRKGTLLGTQRPGHYIDHAKGTRNGLAKAQAAALTKRHRARLCCYSHLLDEVKAMRADDLSFAAIATTLNAAGHRTTNDKQFTPCTVQRMVRTFELAS